ncbi:hypothetical protein [Streptomyces boninensis]|uniref:hypothetical protein n=1 Tax=Streptomyces boninensis TaxID=2039455 RepID=UPI003B21D1BE
MRFTAIAGAAIAVVVLVSGCGGEDSADGGKKSDAKSSTKSSKPADKGRTYKVTFEVGGGKGESPVTYNAGVDINHFGEKVTLPWTKTVEIKLQGVEAKRGAELALVPGPALQDDGFLKKGSCVIKVDGKTVAEQPATAKSGAGYCKYVLKG